MKRPDGTFFVVPRAVLTMGLSTGAIATVVSLCSHADEEGECYPALATIGAQIKADPSSVRRHLKELQARKVVFVHSRRARRAVSRYRLAKWLWRCEEQPKSAQDERTQAGPLTVSGEVRSEQAAGPLMVSHELDSGTRTRERDGIAVADSEQGPTTAAEARQAYESMLRELKDQHLGPPSTRRSRSSLSCRAEAVGVGGA